MNQAAPRRGQLRELPLPEVLGALARDRLTGVVGLKLPSGPAEIYLVEGQVAAVELPGGIDRLAEVLEATGVMEPELIRRSLAAPRPPGLRYGRLLVESGLIEPAQLQAALRLQIKRRLHRLFFAEEGEFSVEPGEHTRGLEAGERVMVDVRRSIVLGVRSAWKEPRFGARLPAGKIRLAVAVEQLLTLSLSPAEQAVLQPLSGGAMSIDELVAAAAGGEAEKTAARALLYSLLAGFVLTVEGTGASTAPPIGNSSPASSVPQAVPHERTLPLRGGPANAEPPPRRTPPPASNPSMSAIHTTSPGVAPASVPPPGMPRSLSTPPLTPSRPLPTQPLTPRAPLTPPAGSPVPRSNPGMPTSGSASPAGGPRSVTVPVTPRSNSGPMTPPRPMTSPSSRPPFTPPSFGPRTLGSLPLPPSLRQAMAPSVPVGPVETDPIAIAITKKRASVENEDFFQVLGVSRDADRAAIKAAYLEAARAYHPDRLAAAGLLHLRTAAEHVFRRVSEAHATLSDDRRRAGYLEKLNESPEVQAQQAQAQRILAAEMALREGELALKRRDFGLALMRLGEAVKLNPAEGEALAIYCYARAQAGQVTLAELKRDFEQAVIKSPDSGRAHYYLGLARKQANDLKGAVASFRRAVDADERLTEAASELRVLQTRLSKK